MVSCYLILTWIETSKKIYIKKIRTIYNPLYKNYLMQKYSIFSLIKNAFSNHQNWDLAWKDPTPKKRI